MSITAGSFSWALSVGFLLCLILPAWIVPWVYAKTCSHKPESTLVRSKRRADVAAWVAMCTAALLILLLFLLHRVVGLSEVFVAIIIPVFFGLVASASALKQLSKVIVTELELRTRQQKV